MRRFGKILLDFRVLYAMLGVILILGVGSVYVTNQGIKGSVNTVRQTQVIANQTNLNEVEEGRCVGIASTDELQHELVVDRQALTVVQEVETAFPQAFKGVLIVTKTETPQQLQTHFDQLNANRNKTLHCKDGHYDPKVNGVIEDAT